MEVLLYLLAPILMALATLFVYRIRSTSSIGTTSRLVGTLTAFFHPADIAGKYLCFAGLADNTSFISSPSWQKGGNQKFGRPTMGSLSSAVSRILGLMTRATPARTATPLRL